MKHPWKKRLVSAVCAVLAVGMLAGCGASSTVESGGSPEGNGEKERREITAMVMQSRNVPGLQKMIDKLAEEENIIVDLQVVPDDQYDNLIKMKLNSGEAPDLIDYNMPKICGFLGNEPEKYLADLSDEPWVDRMVNPDAFRFEGKMYGYCFTSMQGFQAMLYNKDVFEQAGITEEPTTKEEFVPFPVSWTVKMKKKQKETQDILSYHTQAAGCSDKARAKASGGRQPIEECGRTGL